MLLKARHFMTASLSVSVKKRIRALIDGGPRADLRIVGVPRSGTNFLKYLVESGSSLVTAYNLGWWKHGVIPPLMNGQEVVWAQTPTLVMHREPLEQMVSFFKFAVQGRTAIRTEATDFSTFIRSPIRMQPYDGMEYWFADPISYWLQFYWAALAWPAPKAFFDLDAVRAAPEGAFGPISLVLERDVAVDLSATRLDQYVGRNPDQPVAQGFAFDASTSFDAERARNERLLADIAPEDQHHILRDEVRAMRARLLAAAPVPPHRPA